MAEPAAPFDTVIETGPAGLQGPWRGPRQMLAEQTYDDHASIHDEATAKTLGFAGAAIEGPTHFSQFAPLAVALWGPAWFERGCISAHYRTPVFEGERVRARVAAPPPGARSVAISMEKEDGAEVLRGTLSIGPDHAPTALDVRLAELAPLQQPVILEDVRVGVRGPRLPVRMDAGQHMGALYPFSLADKLGKITEPSAWYAEPGATPYGRAIIPVEMISVLVNYAPDPTPRYTRGPVVGLFADQEIRLIDGPLFVGEDYEIEREVVALSGSRRTESLWILTRVYAAGSETVKATTLLNSAILKESYAAYAQDYERMYGAA
jgi:hypothetical protein